MKKVLLLFCLLFSLGNYSFAIDHSANLVSLAGLSRQNATREQVTAMLGKPGKIQENKKRIWWHYSNDSTNLVICWNKKSDAFENFSFKSLQATTCMCNSLACRKLQSGTTDIAQAMRLLGTPADMKIKGTTQEMHYAYQGSKLRLFFRNHILVDVTLLSQPGK